MIKVYRKTATIKAEQFDGSDEMVDKYDIEVVEGDYAEDYSMPEAGPVPYFRYFMASGYNEICVGDWIATGIKGEHWAISDDVFKKTYKELPVITKEVAGYIKESHGYGTNVYEAVDCAYSLSKNGKNSEAKLGLWIKNNSDTFVRAFLDGYTVEEDK